MTRQSEVIYALWLKGFKGVTDRTSKILLQKFGSFENIHAAAVQRELPSALSEHIPSAMRLFCALCENTETQKAEQTFLLAEKFDIKTLCLSQEDYPPLLQEIYDPPTVLYYKGSLAPLKRPSTLAVVGARTSDSYGLYAARELSRAVSRRGICVISGLALGTDAAAHRGALEGEGGTVAVLAGGLDSIFPAANRSLAEGILREGGALLSEKPPGYPSIPSAFPPRNRIISGLSQACLIIRAARKSGSLITAKSALSQNREVLALPGNIGEALSEGPNSLIRNGAVPITCPEDIFEALGYSISEAAPAENFEEKLTGEEQALLRALLKGCDTPDAIAVEMKCGASRINTLITLCELKGIISTNMGKVKALYRR